MSLRASRRGPHPVGQQVTQPVGGVIAVLLTASALSPVGAHAQTLPFAIALSGTLAEAQTGTADQPESATEQERTSPKEKERASANEKERASAGATRRDLAYTTEIKDAPADLSASLRAVSDLIKKTRPLPTRAAIRLTGRNDARAMTDVLRAAGYYDAAVAFELEDAGDDGDGKTPPVSALFTVTAGPAFRITDHQLIYVDANSATRADGDGEANNSQAEDTRPQDADTMAPPQDFAALGIKTTENAAGSALKQVQDSALLALWDQGYPGAQIIGRRAVADIEAGTAHAEYRFEAGPRARFGAVKVTGEDKTNPTFLERLKTWEDGDLYQRDKLIAYRDKLSATGIFASVDAAPGAVEEDGRAPVIVTIEERKRRTVGAGVSFSTVEGIGGRLFLEYRNMFGRGETARAEIQATEIEQAIFFSFDKPFPRLPGNAFANASFSNQTTDAFDAQTFFVSAGLAKRWLDGRLETRGALALETSNIRTETSEERVFLISTPLSAIYNTETDPLALARGVQASFTVTPFTGTDSFVRNEFAARSRVNFGADNRFTIAGRTRLGALLGTSLQSLPANQRFFAGGGSSVRGFEFQAVGPVDAEGIPIGGRSVIEGAVEARAVVYGPVQLAAFIDTGSVSASSLPDFGGDFQTGVGGGVRYLSPVGPLRVDIAFPLEKREQDRAFQLFISLGQPF